MSHDALRELSALCQQLRDAQREADEAEALLKGMKEHVRRLTEEDIPTLMQELGVQKLKLESGEQISVGLEVDAQIPKGEKARAFAWLEDNGHGGLIKTEVSVAFGRNGIEDAQHLARDLAGRGMEPVVDRSVHTGTLKAFIKERLTAGSPVPLELFGARIVNRAKIK